MSPTIFAIAAIPAAAVYFVGLLSKNRSKTLMSAIAIALLGVVTGSATYIITDLFFVAVAYLWTSGNFTPTEVKVNSTVFGPTPSGAISAIKNTSKKAKNVLLALVVAAVTMAAVFFFMVYAIIWYNSTQKLVDPAASLPPAAIAPVQSPTVSLPNHPKYRAAKTEARAREGFLDKRDCLTLLDNEEIARCSLTLRLGSK